jgi:hypothetical protein
MLSMVLDKTNYCKKSALILGKSIGLNIPKAVIPIIRHVDSLIFVFCLNAFHSNIIFSSGPTNIYIGKFL